MAFGGGSSWLTDFSACEAKAQEIMEQIAARNQQQRNSNQYAKISFNVRQLMKAFSNDVSHLRQDLIKASSSYHITQREAERRERMLDNLANKERQMEMAFSDGGPGANIGRSSLLGTDLYTSASVHQGMEESEDTRNLTVDEIRQQQELAIKEQDKGLDSLYNAVVRQKHMAEDIGNELETQNELIDEIIDHADTTTHRLVKETRHVKIVDHKSGSCWYWMVIVLLLIAIIVVVAIPHP